MNLRPYQQDAVDSIESGWSKHRSQLLILPTGTGKTVVFTHWMPLPESPKESEQ